MLHLLQLLILLLHRSCVSAVLLLFVTAVCATNSSYSGQLTPVIVHDLVPAIKPISDDHELVNAHTLRSIPKWSQVKADGKPRYVETLIFIDSEVKNWFRNDKQQIRRGIASLMHGINLYVEQINTRIVILDIMEIVGYNITLEQLSHYRAENMNHLPEHDLAVLIRYGYEGGIAYVNGICTQSAVGITGFLPDSPLEYAAIFFHELAHLFGLTHDTDTECFCGNTEEPCLKIDGFNECSVQTLVDRLPMHECIQKPPVNLPNTVLPICGNHYLEPGEECDCGPEKFCKSLVCDPISCKRTITDLQMFISVAVLIGGVIIVVACCCNWSQHNSYKNCKRDNTQKLMVSKNWEKPTFLPLESSQTDPEIPIWKTPPYIKNQKTLDGEKDSQSSDKTMPIINPRAHEYVNITRSTTNSVDCGLGKNESIAENDTTDYENVLPIKRPINRDTNKAIVRRPPSIPYLLDIGTLELPPKDSHTGAENNEDGQLKNVHQPILINNQLNSVISKVKFKNQGEIFSRSLSEADSWNKIDDSNVNDALLNSSNDIRYRSATIVVGVRDIINQTNQEQQSELLDSHL